MDLKVLSDDGDVLRLKMTSGIVQEGFIPDLTTPLEDLLGPSGYARNVLVSLAEVPFVDSRCLGWLMMIHRRFCEAGGRLIFHSSPPSVTEALQILRFERVFRIAEDETAALEMLRREGPSDGPGPCPP